MNRHPIFALADEVVRTFSECQPDLALISGIAGNDDRWTDYSAEAADRFAEKLRAIRANLVEMPPAQDRWDSLAIEVVESFLAERIDDHERFEYFFDLNAIESPTQQMRVVFDVIDVSGESGKQAVLRRLETLPAALASYRARLAAGMRRGLVVAKRQVRAVLQQSRHLAGGSSFFLSLKTPLSAFDQAQVDRAIERARVAFSEFAGWLEQEYLVAATERDAVGAERYSRAARRFLGSSIDAVETYAWGWQQVRDIEAKMRAVSSEILPGAPISDVIEMLKTDPSRCASDGEALVRVVAERQQRALADLDGVHFDIPDAIRRIDVKIAPPGGVLGAYYLQPNEDFSRPGTVYYSLGETRPIPIWNEITTAYHEGFPGHHLQVGLQVYFAERLTRLHRLLVCYSGYAEGWALYAEELMNELGYLEKPEYVLGMLAAKLFRAARVVIDIGLHLELEIPDDEPFHPRETWNFELAAEFLEKRVFAPRERAESEVTRYLGWPGQAISYKVGERVFFELRDAVAKREQERFDLKRFHERVLGSGSVGLDLLRRLTLAAP